MQADAASKALTSSQAAVEAAAEQLAGSEAEERFKLWAAVQQQSEAAEVLQWNVSRFAMAKQQLRNLCHRCQRRSLVLYSSLMQGVSAWQITAIQPKAM